MQTNLFGKNKTTINIKESYGGFEVCNSEHIDFAEITPKPFRMGSVIIKQFNSYAEAKESFERECRQVYETDVKWLKSKFQDAQGFFWLDGVKVNWELKTFYITEYHMEFNTENKEPCLLTETGYRSNFPSNLDSFDSIKDYLVAYLDYEINCDEKGNRNKKQLKYRLDWEDSGYKPPKQMTLIQMKGGTN